MLFIFEFEKMINRVTGIFIGFFTKIMNFNKGRKKYRNWRFAMHIRGKCNTDTLKH